MGETVKLNRVSDDEILRRLAASTRQSRCVEADVVSLIAEADARKLYAREACSSMFDYCRQVLGLRENEAYLRITVARASREHPAVLAMLRDGRLHVSGIASLARHLTRENRDAVLKRATGMSHREIKELVRELEPQPDAPSTIRKLPERAARSTTGDADRLSGGRFDAGRLDADSLSVGRGETSAPGLGLVGSGPLDNRGDAGPSGGPGTELGAHRVQGFTVGAVPDGAAVSARLVPTHRTSAKPVSDHRARAKLASARRATVEPLAPARYKVCFTVGTELREKLERLQALMRSTVPDGDLAKIIDVAVTRELERMEAQRFAKTRKPRKKLEHTDTAPSSRRIPAAVRRAVHQRDGGRCAYEDRRGRRCTKRHDLEFHHEKPFGRGGDHSPENLALMCRAHNTLLAEHDYGEEVMARFRRSARHVEGRRGVDRVQGAPRVQRSAPG
jgi:hypothetical protein